MATKEGKKEQKKPNPTVEIRKSRVLEALMTAGTLTEAAKIAQVSQKTIYSYMHDDPEFLVAYRDLQRERLRTCTDLMGQGIVSATEYITKLINDKTAKDCDRLSAACRLLELYGRYRILEGSLNADILYETKGKGKGSGERINRL